MLFVLWSYLRSSTILAGCLLVLACSHTLSSVAQADEWNLVFEDRFDGAAPAAHWVLGNNGAIADGSMAFGLQGNGLALLDRSFAPDVKVELLAESMPDRPPCDLSIGLACWQEPVSGYGYLAAFGGMNNTMHQIIGGGDMPPVSHRYPPRVIEPGRRYTVTAAKQGRNISLEVDGELILTATDSDPLSGPGHDRIGLVTWNGMLVHQVRVWERAQPHPDTPHYLTGLKSLPLHLDPAGRLTGARTEHGQQGCQLFNAGQYRQAEKHFLRATDPLERALGVAWCVGHVEYEEDWHDCQRVGSLLLAAAEVDPSVPDLDLYARQVQAMTLLRGQPGSNPAVALRRLVAIGPENNPFYDKASFYQARFIRASGQESASQEKLAVAREMLRDLYARYPRNASLKELNGETVPWGSELSIEDEAIPTWARGGAELYARQLAVLRQWFLHRQLPDGQLGGGWGDDVEILRNWGLLAFISDADPAIRNGIEKLSQGVWAHCLSEYGFEQGIGDVEHSAEPSADTVPTMLVLRYGDPLWLERNFLSCRTIRDIYTGIDWHGFRRFKSSYYGGDQVGQSVRDGGDTWYNTRTMKHVVGGAWYGHPELQDLFVNWADGWLLATCREWSGKPAGVVPDTIWYPSGEIATPGTDDWQADVGQYRGGPASAIDNVFLSAWKLTGWRRFLATLKPDADQFYFTQDPWQVGERLVEAAQDMRTNLLLQTREVLQTDRAGLHHAHLSYAAFSGGTDNWRESRLPTSVASWDVPSASFAAVILEASATALTAWFYNLSDQPMDAAISLWRLDPGRYEVKLGQVLSGPGEPHRYQWQQTTSLDYLRRATPWAFTAAPRIPLVIQITQQQSLPAPPLDVPDLAIHPRDLKYRSGQLQVTVHNVGAAPAPSFDVVLLHQKDGSLQEVARQKVSGLKAPLDLKPRRQTVKFDQLPDPDVWHVVLDPDNTVDELYEFNNVAQLDATARPVRRSGPESSGGTP